MGIPIRAMHQEVKDAYLGEAERTIKLTEGFNHPVAGRDPVWLAYILWAEAGNPDIYEEARSNWDEMRRIEKVTY